jgi:TolB protein
MWTIRLAAVTAVLLLLGWAAEERGRFAMRMIAVDEMGGGDATISPDGRRFVTTSRRSGDWELWIYDMDAGRWSQVTHDPGEDFEAKWSPDGTRLVFTSSRSEQKDIWTIDLKTGAERRLTTSPEDDEYPAWSPDGKSIVYTGGPWNARDFFVVPAEGGEPRKITRRSRRAGACTFEPGGETLVCHRYDSGTGDIERVWVRDGEVVPLTAGSSWDYKPTTSPDTRFVAFSRSIEGPSKIWMMPATGGRPWPVTSGPGDDRWPTWSDDGKRLLFHRAAEQSLGVERIDRSSNEAPATIVPAAEQPLQASAAPDGRRVAYCAETPSGRRVRVREIADGRTREVDAGGREACFPRWSPGGDRLALIVRDGERWEVAVAASTGGSLRLLTAGHAELRGMDGPVDWSPDGRRLVFHADTEPFEARLYTVDVQDGTIEPLTSGGFFDESPSWTPDGRDVLFMSTRGGNWTWGLYRVAIDTGTIEPFVTPDWTEKNFPRQDAAAARVWTTADTNGVDRLMEQRRGSVAHVLERAGSGARWPAYSRDGRSIIYTRIAHRMEFWVIDNPSSRGPTSTERPFGVAQAAGTPTPSAYVASPRTFQRR